MAQPQHTRNDSHMSPVLRDWFALLPLEARLGFYEQYTDLLASLPIDKDPLRYNDYASVYPGDQTTTFNTPRKFFTNGLYGMADYSNRNFVTEGTNFAPLALPFPFPSLTIPPGLLEPLDIHRHDGLPFPNGDSARIELKRIEELPPAAYAATLPDNVRGELAFVRIRVTDFYRPEDPFPDARTSTYSIFDDALQNMLERPEFSVNRYNFDAALSFFVPRAVGYSTGFINYFFRGQFRVRQVDYATADYVLENQSTETLSGTYSLYYDDANGNRYPLPSQTVENVQPMESDPYTRQFGS